VAAWLLICCALVFVMLVGGGITRLTHSGLSMVEWQPIMGTIPPLDEAQWRSPRHIRPARCCCSLPSYG
jgi:cytochrome c oxidase assembly protein subunit 15